MLAHPTPRPPSSVRAGPAPATIVHVLGEPDDGRARFLERLFSCIDRSRWNPVVVVLTEAAGPADALARVDAPLRFVRGSRGLWALLAGESARVVHAHDAASLRAAAIAAHVAGARAARRPRVVHTRHGEERRGEGALALATRAALALCDRVVVTSAELARDAVDVERVPPRKVVTIPNGVDTHAFRPRADPTEARARLGVPRHGFHVGCVARLAPVKDHRTLLDAFAMLRSSRPDAHLTLVGDGPERAMLERRAASPDLSGAVTFAGARDDVATLMGAFDAVALASIVEGTSPSLLEASASALPVVATRVGGNVDLVAHGETGFLVPLGDAAAFAEALAELAARPDRATLGAAGRARVERRFSVERMARGYVEVYAEVLGIA